jgi:hypothetical protein
VYAATNDVIAAHLAGNASEASAYLDTFRRRRKDAEFLLPEETNAFLTEVFDAVNTYRDARSVIAKNRNDDPHKDAAENSVRKAEVVLMDLHGRLVEQFRSPLDLSR